jgi:M3 family oligoendopeptidase
MDLVTPPLEDRDLDAAYARVEATLDQHATPAGWRAAFGEWDALRREWSTFESVIRLRYTQNTRDEERRAAQSALDTRLPSVTARDVRLKKRFLAGGGLSAALEDELGPQAFALWKQDVTAFDDAIAGDLVREAELEREYTELLANASAPFEGAERSLGDLGAFYMDADREKRHAAQQARWGFFTRNREQLDDIYDRLVHLRDGMARKLGFANYLELGYRRMHRVDYGPSDVARYRDDVARSVVPVAASLVRRLGAESGLDRVRFWDEAVLGSTHRIAPQGDRAWILGRTAAALGAIAPELGEFAGVMLDGDLLDVERRPGKALGAYCTFFPTRGLPYVFANFDGTRSDVRTLMHELGHAFQAWSSRGKDAIDYLFPTLEAAEVHSMSLEYLSWPEMERYFGLEAGAYRREHLFDALLFLPYGVAVDHFQHLVYANPGATPAERHAMWQEVERRYLPWREYGDLAHPRAGGLWQEKRHIYLAPFYYIDYTLALCCALQFWTRAEVDRGAAIRDYVGLCGRGGEAPFGELVRSAGLRSPFGGDALRDVVDAAKATFQAAG